MAEDSEEEDDDDDDDRSHVSDTRARNFYPFNEDTTVPDPEELRIMQSYVESSASDDKHWQQRTFFDLQDPEFAPGEDGKIEWTITGFNGTKENPRNNLLLTSHTVEIGGYQWRIKLLPHGNMHTDRLSLYVENVSIQSMAPEEWPKDKLPLPVVGDVKVMKRRAVAAQMSILVYNPEEPRVNEFRADAHQFYQDSPDHGWTRFTSMPWYEIHRRSYAQRQPLLRNDTLAIKAYIRIIDDPTGCLWAVKEAKKTCETKSAMTGLIPFLSSFEDSALTHVLTLWLHLRPFRQIIYRLGPLDLFNGFGDEDDDDNILPVLQATLWRMRSRRVPDPESAIVPFINEYLEYAFDEKGSQDILQAMHDVFTEMSKRLQRLASQVVTHDALEQLCKVFGKDQFSGSRQTKRSIVGKTSMQEIVDDGLPKSLLQSDVLTLELERQVFDSEKRVWKKLLDKVRLDDQITAGGVTYTLFGFASHEGHLRNGKYSSFFRPGGLGGLWYTYKNLFPVCQTRTQAVLSKEGVTPPQAVEEPLAASDRPVNFDRLLGQVDAVAYVVIYVRNDANAFDLSVSEPWEVPEWISDNFGPRPATPMQASIGASEGLSYDENTTENGDQEMNDASDGSIGGKTSEQDSEDDIKTVTINYLSHPFYEGQIKDGEFHGQGHLIYLNGDEYTGTLISGGRSGHGTMTYRNGDIYEGDWQADQHHGQGKYTEKRTGNVYEGNWEEGKKHGTGTTFWKCSEEETRMCRICYCNEADAAFYDCGHVVACVGCARRVEDCPVCRRRVRDVIRLFYLA